MYFASLASSSDGNSYVLYNEPDKLILIDAGISFRRIKSGLESLTLDISNVHYILVTHLHHDHIYGLDVISRKIDSNILVHSANAYYFKRKDIDCITYKNAQSFKLLNISIMPFEASHDVHTSSFIFEYSGRKLSFVSDTGILHDYAYDLLFDSDMLALESNYSDLHLPLTDYPEPLKARIDSHKGHLSNVQAKDIINTVYSDRLKQVLFIHVSKRSNSPQIIKEQTVNILIEQYPEACFEIAPYDSPSQIFNV